MAENVANCPLCTTPVPRGAIVCRGCGATRQSFNASLLLPFLFVGAFYLFWGPMIAFMGLTHLGNDDTATGAAILGVLVTIGGFIPMRWIVRKLGQPVWVR